MKKIFLASESEVFNKLVPTILSDFEVIISEKSDSETLSIPSAQEDISLMIADGEIYYAKIREIFTPDDMPVLILLPEHAERVDLADDKNAHVIRLPFILFHFVSTVKYMVDPSLLKGCSLEPIPVLKPFINPIASESAARNNAAVDLQASEIDEQNAEKDRQNDPLEAKESFSLEDQNEQNSDVENSAQEASSEDTGKDLPQDALVQETQEITENTESSDSEQNAQMETEQSSEIQSSDENSSANEALSESEDNLTAEHENNSDSGNDVSEEKNEENPN